MKLDIFTNITILEQRIEELGLLHICEYLKIATALEADERSQRLE